MGLFSKGTVASLSKQAEEALKPKEEVKQAEKNLEPEEEVIDITADEAQKITQEVLTSESILEAARSFAEKCYPVIKERAQNGYDYTSVSVSKYDFTNPKHSEIIKQARKILEEKGYETKRDFWDNTLVIRW